MILKETFTEQWIKKVAHDSNIHDITLIEKSIRAFALLESLVVTGCPLVFKGGTALMLLLNSNKRLSIDIDIICPPNTDLSLYLGKAKEYGFLNVELIKRDSRHNVPKNHSKFYYEVAYKTSRSSDYILLDVLFEENHYNEIIDIPIKSPFLLTDNNDIIVRVPSKQDILGDKLTAYAPNTIGIPYFKREKCCSMEIIKQLYDVASIFDTIEDISTTINTFRKFAEVEMTYRQFTNGTIEQVLEDIYETSLCLCLKGMDGQGDYELLLNGIKRVRSFIHSEIYQLDTAIVQAAKAAYLSELIRNNISRINHYNGNITALRDAEITTPLNTKLNKLKKVNLEAFFYWYEIFKLKSK